MILYGRVVHRPGIFVLFVPFPLEAFHASNRPSSAFSSHNVLYYMCVCFYQLNILTNSQIVHSSVRHDGFLGFHA